MEISFARHQFPLTSSGKNLAFVVDRSPEPESPAGDQNCHLVQMPARGGPMTSAAKFPGEQRPELQHPSSDRFIGEVQPALGQQIFDIAEAEGKAKIQPHGVGKHEKAAFGKAWIAAVLLLKDKGHSFNPLRHRSSPHLGRLGLAFVLICR
jgi:hypothetical protein